MSSLDGEVAQPPQDVPIKAGLFYAATLLTRLCFVVPRQTESSAWVTDITHRRDMNQGQVQYVYHRYQKEGLKWMFKPLPQALLFKVPAGFLTWTIFVYLHGRLSSFRKHDVDNRIVIPSFATAFVSGFVAAALPVYLLAPFPSLCVHGSPLSEPAAAAFCWAGGRGYDDPRWKATPRDKVIFDLSEKNLRRVPVNALMNGVTYAIFLGGYFHWSRHLHSVISERHCLTFDAKKTFVFIHLPVASLWAALGLAVTSFFRSRVLRPEGARTALQLYMAEILGVSFRSLLQWSTVMWTVRRSFWSMAWPVVLADYYYCTRLQAPQHGVV